MNFTLYKGGSLQNYNLEELTYSSFFKRSCHYNRGKDATSFCGSTTTTMVGGSLVVREVEHGIDFGEATT